MSTLAADAFREQSTPGANQMLGVWPAIVRVPWPSGSYDGCACGRHCRPNLVFDTTGNSKDPGLSPDRERRIQQCGTHDCDQLAADFQWTADDVLDTADCGYADGAVDQSIISDSSWLQGGSLACRVLRTLLVILVVGNSEAVRSWGRGVHRKDLVWAEGCGTADSRRLVQGDQHGGMADQCSWWWGLALTTTQGKASVRDSLNCNCQQLAWTLCPQRVDSRGREAVPGRAR